MVLRAAERLHTLPGARPVLVHVARDRGRAHKRHRRDARMLQDCVDRDLVTVHDVEHAVRHTGLLQQLRHVQRRRRILLRRLQHERVPARERGRPHPHWHHRREVERRDSGDNAQRLPDRVHVDPRRRLFREAALQELRNPAAVLDHLETARDLSQRIGKNLAVLGGQDPRNVLAALIDEVANAEEDRRPLRQRHRAPRRKRLLRRLDGPVDLLDRRKVDGARLHAPGRVVDRPAAPRRAFDDAAADPVADPRDVLLSLDGWRG